MKAGMILQCGNCVNPVDEKWTSVDEQGRQVCPYCGVVNNFSDSEEVIQENEKFREIYYNLDNLKFDAACEALEKLRELYPKSSQVYFLSVLAENCVCYTEDGEDKKRRIPTLNDLPEHSLLESSFAKRALDLAESDLVRKSYQDTFDYIEKVRQEIKADADNPEYHYDIFISTKVTLLDENGNEVLDGNNQPKESPDCANARELYNYIREKNPKLRIFFSQSTDARQKMAGQKYENVIFAALHSARAFILVVESRQSIEWRWVRNEWKRYLRIRQREPEDRHFVVWTQNLNPGDLPIEIKSLNYIKRSFVDATDQLKSFLNKAFSGNKDEGPKIKKSEFVDSDVGTIEPKISVLEDEPIKKRQLATSVAATTAEIQDQIDAFAYNLDPRYPETRRKTFLKLEAFLKENPDVYEAKKLMLLKDTDYASLENYLSRPTEVIKKPEILAEFLKFATVEDGKKSLIGFTKQIAKPDFYFDFNEDDAVRNIPDWSAKLANALSNIVLNYLEDIDVEDLRALRMRLQTIVLEKLNYECDPNAETNPQEDVLKCYLTLCRYINGNNPNAYINVRYTIITSFKRFYPDKRDVIAKIQQNLVDEILKVNPSDYTTVWVDFCLRKFADPYNGKNGVARFINDIKNGNIELSVANNKETIDLFVNTLFKYTRDKEREMYTFAFLTLIIYDKNTYVQKENEAGASLSDEDAERSIYELSGAELFEKYISYPLPEIVYDSTLEEGLDPKSTLLTPNPDAYLKNEKPTPFDYFLCSFAVALHKHLMFDKAIYFYSAYLNYQVSEERGGSLKSLDCLLIRFYRELANVRVPETEDLKHIGQVLEHDDIDTDILSLRKTLPCAMNILNTIRSVSEYQTQYFDTYQYIKILADRLPRERTIEKLDLLTKIRDDIMAKLNSLNDSRDKAVKAELKRDFKMELEFFDKKLPKLEDAAIKIGEMFSDNSASRIEKVLTEGYRDLRKAYNVAKVNAEEFIKNYIEPYDNPGLKKAHTGLLNKVVSNLAERVRKQAGSEAARRFFGGLFTFIFSFLFPLAELTVPGAVVLSFINSNNSEALPTDLVNLIPTFIIVGGLTAVIHQLAITFMNPEKFKYNSAKVAHAMSRIICLIAAISLVIFSGPFVSGLLGGVDFYENYHIYALAYAAAIFIIQIVNMYLNRDEDRVSTNVGGLSYIFLRVVLLIVPVFVAIQLFSGWGSCFTDYMSGCSGGDCTSCSCACFGIDCSLSDSGYAFVNTPDLFANFGLLSTSQIVLLFVGLLGTGLWSLINTVTRRSHAYRGEIPYPYMKIASVLTIIVCALYVLLGGLALLNGLFATTCQACTFFCYNCGCGSCASACGSSSSSGATDSLGDTCAFGSNQTNLLIGLGFAALGGLDGAANITEGR